MTNLWTENFVDVNKYSRPALPLKKVVGFVLHWTANPGASDTAHQKFFDGDDGGGSRYAGAHMFVDSDSATLIIPENEIAYHANEHACRIEKLKGEVKRKDGTIYHGDANCTTLSLEMCVEKDGTIHPKTIERSIQIMAAWCTKYKLKESDIYRHFDVTGKNCPAPFVKDPSQFGIFKKKVKAILDAQVKPVKPAPSKPKPKPKPTAYKGSSLVDYLKSVHKPTDFVSRRKMAEAKGIKHYTGTAAENTKLLKLLRGF